MLQARKTPHCRICGSPMKGHDRAICSPRSPSSSPTPGRLLDRIDIMPGTLDGMRPSERGWSPYPTPEPHSPPRQLQPPSESSSRWPEWQGFEVKSEVGSISDLLSEVSAEVRLVDRILLDDSRSPTPVTPPVDYRDLTALGYGRHGNGNAPLATVFCVPRSELQTLFVKAERLNLQCCLMNRPYDNSASKEEVWVVVGESVEVVEQIADFASTNSKLGEKRLQLVSASSPKPKKRNVCGSESTCNVFTLLLTASTFGGCFAFIILMQF